MDDARLYPTAEAQIRLINDQRMGLRLHPL